ncbi:MAG: hypothetical protein WC933_02205 [Candidatus Paceibacterota bacterium]|jgi:hypothetical protein
MIFKIDEEKERDILYNFIKIKKSEAIFEAYKIECEFAPISNDNEFIKKQVDVIKKIWNLVAENYYNKLGKFYEIKISEPDITCLLTRFSIFPYNFSNDGSEKCFSAPLFANPVERNRIIMHELCHYFQPVELPESIKEAIPVILNDQDNFKMYSNEKGHQNDEEQKWRKIIWDLYNRGEKFSDLLKIIKENQQN